MSNISDNPKSTNVGSFIRPSIKNCGQNKTENLVEKVTEILKDNPHALTPDDPIYSAALEQYNKGIRAATTDRMPVPEGFCGVRNPALELLIIPIDTQPNIQIDPLPTPVNTDLSQGPGYPVDRCLQFGEPGSIGYDICGGQITDPSLLPERNIPRKTFSPTHYIGFVVAGDELSRRKKRKLLPWF